MKGQLYVVATPIGNLQDCSARAVQVLQTVDLIAAEDTRHSKRLLNHFGITTALISLHEHNEEQRTEQLLSKIIAGQSLALISDAGTPLVSDPGFRLVRKAREQNISVLAVPGPCSAIAALSIAGLATDRFAFEGFLPARKEMRRKRLQALQNSPYTLIFFLSSHRLQQSLTDMIEILGSQRQALLARELTKRFEQSHWATLAEISHWLSVDEQRLKGEFVLVVAGNTEPIDRDQETAKAQHLLAVLLEELPVKQAVKLATKLSSLSKNELYALALKQSA